MAHRNDLTPRSARPAGLHVVAAARRALLGRTQSEIAAAAGVKARTLQRLERGEAVAADTILRVERALGLQAGTLVPEWSVQGPSSARALGPRMRELRRERGVTLTEAAEWSGRSASTLSRLERGVLGEVDPWDPRINRRLIEILGFRDEERFEDWASGYGPAPRPSGN